jgi:hypothetical protein
MAHGCLYEDSRPDSALIRQAPRPHIRLLGLLGRDVSREVHVAAHHHPTLGSAFASRREKYIVT